MTDFRNFLYYFNRELSINRRVELENQLGLLYYSTDQYIESLHLYENILKNAPNYTEASTNYVCIYYLITYFVYYLYCILLTHVVQLHVKGNNSFQKIF